MEIQHRLGTLFEVSQHCGGEGQNDLARGNSVARPWKLVSFLPKLTKTFVVGASAMPVFEIKLPLYIEEHNNKKTNVSRSGSRVDMRFD